MNITLEMEEESGHSSPVYEEPYVGFFKDHGFKVEGRVFGLCDSVDSHRKTITVALDRVLYEADDFPLPLAPVITLERVIYYGGGIPLDFGDYGFGRLDDPNTIKCVSLRNIVQREKSGEDTAPVVKAMLDAVEKAGGKAWHGYTGCVSTSGSYQGALVEEDFSDARKTVEDFIEYAARTAQDVYSRLDVEGIRLLRGNLPQLYDTLCQGLMSMMQDADSGKYNKEMESLSEEEQDKRWQEFAELPVKTWLPTFERELQSAGLDQCEKELYDKIANYCSSNGIRLIGSTFGNDFRKSIIMARFESAMG